MNNEYWNALLLGKPRIWFYITVVLFIATGVFLMLDWKQGRVVAMPAMFFAVMGWLGSEASGMFFSDENKKSRRSWFGWMFLLIAVPVISIWIGKEMFGKEPPLNIRSERRSEMLGLEKVEFLIITNNSGDRVVPISGTLHSAKTTFPISLPPVIKPYETIEVRLQNKNRKWFIEKGESLTIECEGYSKPLTATYQ